jgi:hypothetical protein
MTPIVKRLRNVVKSQQLLADWQLHSEAADRIEGLEISLREIELQLEAHPRPSQRVVNALSIIRKALERCPPSKKIT